MKKLGVVITDGVGYRNFILTDFIKEAQEIFDEVIIFSCLPIIVYENLNLSCKIIELEPFEERFFTWVFRKLKEVTHLQLYAKYSYGITDNLLVTKSEANNIRGIAIRFIHKWSKRVHSEKWIIRYDNIQKVSFYFYAVTQKYQKLLKEHKVSILFFTHQRPPFIAPLIYAAEKLKVKNVTFIFSWDNLGSKGRMAGNFDYYLVWSDLMKQDLLQFYSSIMENQISIVGTPQFEPYILERYGYNRVRFNAKFNIDPQKPIILFTCNDSSSKNDLLYLALLAEFIVTDKLIKEVNLIVRTSPAEEPSRFESISKRYPFIIWNYPEWEIRREKHQEPWTQRVPSVEDLNDLKSLLNYCDLNINVLSTITLDSFIFDKPVINPVFGNSTNNMFDDQKFLKYKHLSALVDSNSTEISLNEQEFLTAVNRLLNKSDNKKGERAKFLELQIGQPLFKTSNRIAETLKGWT